MAAKAQGRLNAKQITLFDSVGFAIEDFSALGYVRDQLQATDLCEEHDPLAIPKSRAICSACCCGRLCSRQREDLDQADPTAVGDVCFQADAKLTSTTEMRRKLVTAPLVKWSRT